MLNHTLHGKGLQSYRNKQALVHWSAARNEERFSSRGYPLTNRLSTADFVPAFGLHGDLSSLCFYTEVKGTCLRCLVSWAKCSVSVQFCPTPPAAPPYALTQPPVVCSGFGCDMYISNQSFFLCCRSSSGVILYDLSHHFSRIRLA